MPAQRTRQHNERNIHIQQYNIQVKTNSRMEETRLLKLIKSLRNMNFYTSIKHEFWKFISQTEEDGVLLFTITTAVLRFSQKKKTANLRRISAPMQCASHCYTTSKQAKEQSLSQNCQTERRTEQNAPSTFPFLSFFFCLFSLCLALEAYREKSCRVMLIATKWAVSGGNLQALLRSVFHTQKGGGLLGLKMTFTWQISRSCSTCLGYPYFCSYFHSSVDFSHILSHELI